MSAFASSPTTESRRARSRIAGGGYLFALLATGIAAVLTDGMRIGFHVSHAMAAYLAAILLTGWYAGSGPASLTLASSILFDVWSWLAVGPLEFREYAVRLAWFLAFALMAATFGSSRRRAFAELRAACEHLEVQVAKRTARLRRIEAYLEDAHLLGHGACWAMYADRDEGGYWSNGMYAILGVPPGPVMSRSEFIATVVAEEDRARVAHQLEDALHHRKRVDVEFRIVRPDGSSRCIRAIGHPFLEEGATSEEFLGLLVDVTEQREAERLLQQTAARLQSLSGRLIEVQEEERRHLARELHDEFGHILATISLHLHAARSSAGNSAQPHLEESIALLRKAAAQMRGLALDLRPIMLETAGLDASLRWLAEQHRLNTGVPVEVVGHVDRVPVQVSIACFRVAQEALTNVITHAQAHQVWIELRQTDSTLEMVVRDDGVGFDVRRVVDRPPASGGLGLLGMKERVEILGGRFEVNSKPDRGTTLTITLPLHPPVPANIPVD